MVVTLNKYYEGFPLCFESYEIINDKIIVKFINLRDEKIQEIKINYLDKEYTFIPDCSNDNIVCVIENIDANLIGEIVLHSIKIDDKELFLKDFELHKELKKPKSINALGREAILFIKEFSKKNKYPKNKIQYVPHNDKDFWHCVCGQTNFGKTDRCTNCSIEKKSVFSISLIHSEKVFVSNEKIKMNSLFSIWTGLIYFIYVFIQMFNGDFIFVNEVKDNIFGIINRFCVPVVIIVSSSLLVYFYRQFKNNAIKIFSMIRLLCFLYLNVISVIFTIYTSYNILLLWCYDIVFVSYYGYEMFKSSKDKLLNGVYIFACILLLMITTIKLIDYSKYDIKVIEDGLELTIKTKEERYTIPEEIDDCPVISICFDADFDYKIKEITITKNVEKIFIISNAVLSNLEKIHLSKANDNFIVQDNILLTKDMHVKLVPITIEEITISSDILLKNSLNYCLGLKKVYISDNVKEIQDNAFYGCPLLEEVVFEEGSTLEKIGQYAFGECTSLKRLELPISLIEVGDAFLFNCQSLEYLKTPFIGNQRENDINNYSAKDVFVNMFTVGDYLQYKSIPESIQTVEVYDIDMMHNVTFYNAKYIKKIILPDKLDNIGIRSFYGCESLEEFIVPDEITIVKESCFENCSSLKRIVIPASVKTIKKDAFKNCEALEEVIYLGNISDLVIEVGNEKFESVLNYK